MNEAAQIGLTDQGLGIGISIALLAVSVLAIVLIILWIFLPFAVFKIKSDLQIALHEQRETNRLLSKLTDEVEESIRPPNR